MQPVELLKVNNISIEEYVQRRQKFAEQMKDNSVAILPGARELTRSRDTEFAFRQHSDFHYLCGFPEPEATLIIEKKEGKVTSSLVCRVKDKDAEIWHGRRIGKEQAVPQFKVDQAFDTNELAAVVHQAINNKQTLYFAQGEYDYADELVFDTLQDLRMGPKKGWSAPTEIMDLRPIVHNMRLFKSEAEAKIMQQAGEISAAAHIRAMQFAANQMRHNLPVTEFQLEAEIHHHYALNGAKHPAYGTIVGGGINACILHYTENQDEIKAGDLVLIDSGCELQGYAADITRTWPVNGKFSAEQKAVYEVVLAAQQAVLDGIGPDATLKSLTDISVLKVTEGLVDLGILTVSDEYKDDRDAGIQQLIKDKAHRAFYMHGCSHWIGLDVHDVGDYNQAGAERKLEAGMAFTIEPGIYIDDQAECDPKWHGIGIRIEDDVLITSTGFINLTESVPKTVAEIEALFK